MLTISAMLLSFTMPAGGELYLSEDSIYAEYKPVDFTLSLFSEDLAARAIAEFRTRAVQPEPAGPEFGVKGIVEADVAGYPTVTVDYIKPAQRARLDDQDNVVLERALEVTRQVYIDLGETHVVFTTWTKADDQDIPAISDAFIDSISTNANASGEVVEIDFLVNMLSMDDAQAAFGDAPLGEAVTVEIVSAD